MTVTNRVGIKLVSCYWKSDVNISEIMAFISLAFHRSRLIYSVLFLSRLTWRRQVKSDTAYFLYRVQRPTITCFLLPTDDYTCQTWDLRSQIPALMQVFSGQISRRAPRRCSWLLTSHYTWQHQSNSLLTCAFLTQSMWHALVLDLIVRYYGQGRRDEKRSG